MGQCTSRKASGSLTTSATFVSHIKPTKMEKPKNCRSNNDAESRKNQVPGNETSQLLGPRKPPPRYSKGVAMSFGFKRRPTPMTSNNGLRDLEISGASTNDPNGNKDETSNFSTRNQTVKDRNMHKPASSQKPTSISTRPSRFGFHQTTTDRTNKVADVKTAPSPTEFGGVSQNLNKSRLISPITELDMFSDKRTKTFTRNVAKTENTERRRILTDNNENSANEVADFKTIPSPVEFGGTTQNFNKSRLTSPITEFDLTNDKRTRIFTRNVTKTESMERRRILADNNENSANKAANFNNISSPTEFVGTTHNSNKSRSPTTEFDMSNDKRTRTFTRNVQKAESTDRRRIVMDSNENSENKMAHSKTIPVEFRGTPQNANKSRLTSPTTELDISNDGGTRTSTRNVVKTESTERRRVLMDSNENSTSAKDRLGGAQIQIGKYTFQTTRLPQPEPVRVIETKTAKTIANNNKRSARIRRQYEEASMKAETLTEDSGFGSNTSGYLGDNDNITNCRYIDTMDDNHMQQSLRSNILNVMENSDSFSETSTPPPLPELPSVFCSINSPKSTNTDKEYGYKDKRDSKRPFIKLGTQRTFLKSRPAEIVSSPQGSIEQDWINAGEAMAEDMGLIVSPIHEDTYENKEVVKDRCVSTCTTVIEAALQTLVKPLELTQSLKTTQKISLADEDPSFTAVAANSITGHLLDEEILSPVDSLLSCSETEEIIKKKMTHSSSNSKDINEKLTPASPETPTNGTYSLSLSDDKEDFLIDDEIADQPELVFEDTINNVDNMISLHYKQEKINTTIEDSIRNQRAKTYELEASPLPSRKRRDFLRSTTGSFESLSPCESIASDDLMMEYDISQTNEVDGCDRRSGSFSSLEDTSKFRFKADDTIFANKSLFKSSSSKPLVVTRTETPNYIKDSPRLLRRKFTLQSSPEHKSPKNNPLHQLGFNSMAYDPTSDCLMLTKANHSAIQQDIIGIKTMLLTLKRVLNESETQNSLNNETQICPYGSNSIQNINNNNEFKVELADLRRQVIFLQGQLEDKEKTVNNLQKRIDYLANQNTQIIVDNPMLPTDIQNRCNAATQTDRIRPVSSSSLTLSGSSMDDSGSLFRLLVK